MSQQLLPGIDRQGFDAACEADEARTNASSVQLRTYAGLTPEFLLLFCAAPVTGK